jgi:hypothetical protein
MEADQPKSFPTMAQIEAQEQPAVVLRPLAGHAQVVTPATIRAAVAAMDASPPFSESQPLLVSLTNPGLPRETNVPAYVVVATWPVPVGTYIGCAPSNDPTSCPFAFATHHVMIFNAKTGSFMLGFSTPQGSGMIIKMLASDKFEALPVRLTDKPFYDRDVVNAALDER